MSGKLCEETLTRILDLPEGKDWVWRGDLNILALSSRLDAAGRERAISECQADWLRSLMHVVPGGGDGDGESPSLWAAGVRRVAQRR